MRRENGDNPGFAIRTRFFDDLLVDAVTRVSQVVVVAAGMDARAHRLPLPPELDWFELDRPELLAAKGRLLAELGAQARCRRVAVGVDLSAAWTGALTAAGFDASRPTAWLVEGLVFYLEPDDVHRLLDGITALSTAGSEIFLDTIGASMLVHAGIQPSRERLAALGFPWRFGTDQPEDDLFSPRGWHATASLYSEVGARWGRWAHPVAPRGTPGVPQSFLVHATRPGNPS